MLHTSSRHAILIACWISRRSHRLVAGRKGKSGWDHWNTHRHGRRLTDCAAVEINQFVDRRIDFDYGRDQSVGDLAPHVLLCALSGETKRVAQMLIDTPEIVEADHVTGEDCFLAKVIVSDVQQLEAVIDRFLHTAIIQSSTVVRRLPKL